jgi:PTH1 family peptidyl-tRNA hydrolase
MTKLLVGLGNPGGRYEKTRHNIGFMVVDQIALELGIAVNKKQCQALVAQGHISDEKVLLVKPQTYMNRSGEAVLELLNFYKDSISDLIIIHDDLDLEFGRIRFKADGGAGGHKGLQSIIKMLGSQDFPRLKIGIGRPPEYIAVEDYVLQEPNPSEKKLLPEVIKEAALALADWNSLGIEKSMNQYNGKKHGETEP